MRPIFIPHKRPFGALARLEPLFARCRALPRPKIAIARRRERAGNRRTGSIALIPIGVLRTWRPFRFGLYESRLYEVRFYNVGLYGVRLYGLGLYDVWLYDVWICDSRLSDGLTNHWRARRTRALRFEIGSRPRVSAHNGSVVHFKRRLGNGRARDLFRHEHHRLHFLHVVNPYNVRAIQDRRRDRRCCRIERARLRRLGEE